MTLNFSAILALVLGCTKHNPVRGTTFCVEETDCGPSTDMGYSVDCKTEITGIRLFK